MNTSKSCLIKNCAVVKEMSANLEFRLAELFELLNLVQGYTTDTHNVASVQLSKQGNLHDAGGVFIHSFIHSFILIYTFRVASQCTTH